MKKKRVTSILIFSLLTVAAYNNVKAMDQSDIDEVPKETNEETMDQSGIDEVPKGTNEETNDTQQGGTNQQNESMQQSEPLSHLNKGSDAQPWNIDGPTNRCVPYVYASGITVGADYLFSCAAGIEKVGSSKLFKIIHESVRDNKKMNMLSSAAAHIGGPLHKYINFLNEKDSLEKGPINFMLKKAAGETANAIALRYGWNFVAAQRKSITDRLKDNRAAKALKSLASRPFVKRSLNILRPLKNPCQDIPRLVTIRALWILEKFAFSKFSLDNFVIPATDDTIVPDLVLRK